MNKVLAVFGIFVTVAYLCVFIHYGGISISKLQTLDLNELGDFLAGTFGPIAILWLILGFFQQGIGLKQNSEVLRIQAEELKNSVEQQRELVEVTREQLKMEMQILKEDRERLKQGFEPKFIFSKVINSLMSGGNYTYRCTIDNAGATVSKLKIEASVETDRITESEYPVLKTLEQVQIIFELLEKKPLIDPIIFTLTYLTGEKVKNKTQFILTPIGNDGRSGGTFEEVS